MAQLHAIVRFIVYLIFTFAIFIFSLLIVANDEYAKDGMVKISVSIRYISLNLLVLTRFSFINPSGVGCLI